MAVPEKVYSDCFEDWKNIVKSVFYRTGVALKDEIDLKELINIEFTF